MTPVIQAGAIYHNATPAMLYEFFMDSDKHSAATGMPAKISRKVGGKWSAFGGMMRKNSGAHSEQDDCANLALDGMEKNRSGFHPRRPV